MFLFLEEVVHELLELLYLWPGAGSWKFQQVGLDGEEVKARLPCPALDKSEV